MGCFSPLKLAYRHEVSELARQAVYHVEEVDFLLIHQRIRPGVLSEKIIKAGLHAAGLIPSVAR